MPTWPGDEEECLYWINYLIIHNELHEFNTETCSSAINISCPSILLGVTHRMVHLNLYRHKMAATIVLKNV